MAPKLNKDSLTDAVINSLTANCRREIHAMYKSEIAHWKQQVKDLTLKCKDADRSRREAEEILYLYCEEILVNFLKEQIDMGKFASEVLLSYKKAKKNLSSRRKNVKSVS